MPQDAPGRVVRHTTRACGRRPTPGGWFWQRAGMDPQLLESLAAAQAGVVSRRQLRDLGIDADRVRNHVAAGRWVLRSPVVVSVFTGPMPWVTRAWTAVLHAGDDAALGGLSLLQLRGLRRWERDEVTVLVGAGSHPSPVPGVHYARTRRELHGLVDGRSALPGLRIEAATLLFAAHERSPRTAHGLLAAVVQQRLTTSAALGRELEGLHPLRRAGALRRSLLDIEGGAQSLAELDLARVCRRLGFPPPVRQRRRRDSRGRSRFLDAEWRLRDGTVLVLEVDGGFHMEVGHWEDDLARQRRLSGPGRVLVRCTARELRDEPELVLEDLRALGLQSCA